MTPFRKTVSTALAALWLIPALVAAQVPPGLSGELRRHDRRGQEGRQGRRLQRDRHGGREPADQGLPGALSGHQVEYNDMNSTEIYNRFISEKAAGAGLGRRAVELGDGPADQAGQRRQRARLRVAGDREPAPLGGVEERGLRHDLRAARHRLQQAPADRRRNPAKPRRPFAARVHAPRPTSSRARSRPTTSRSPASASC
jgi:hypothetical protein